jgi:hypothetical protein
MRATCLKGRCIATCKGFRFSIAPRPRRRAETRGLSGSAKWNENIAGDGPPAFPKMWGLIG